MRLLDGITFYGGGRKSHTGEEKVEIYTPTVCL
jgi:hypothetical protein